MIVVVSYKHQLLEKQSLKIPTPHPGDDAVLLSPLYHWLLWIYGDPDRV